MSVRLYGKPPYQIALVHQPGVSGSLGGLARLLSDRYGVVELIQTQYTVEEMLQEMLQDLNGYQEKKMVLIGHAAGAMLASLYASRVPHNIYKLIFIGAPPLRQCYDYEVEIKRKMYFNQLQLEEYTKVRNALLYSPSTNLMEQDDYLRCYGELCRQTDDYQPYVQESDMYDVIRFNGTMYYKIMKEIREYREKNIILTRLQSLETKIAIIHGKYDVYPLEGLLEPLLKCNIEHTYCLLEDCGHTPWRETYAMKDFQRVLDYEIKDAFHPPVLEK